MPRSPVPKASKPSRASFAEKVHAFVRTVPRGRVTSYGDVAWSIGYPGAARAVGRVMRETPEESPTPCHRVVRAGGHVVPVREGHLILRLREEGVKVGRDGRIAEFHRLRWP